MDENKTQAKDDNSSSVSYAVKDGKLSPRDKNDSSKKPRYVFKDKSPEYGYAVRQLDLQKKGYYKGNVDGIWGPLSKAANARLGEGATKKTTEVKAPVAKEQKVKKEETPKYNNLTSYYSSAGHSATYTDKFNKKHKRSFSSAKEMRDYNKKVLPKGHPAIN